MMKINRLNDNYYQQPGFSSQVPAIKDSTIDGTLKTQNDPKAEKAKAEVDELKKRDAEVRQHEMAHISAGGAYIKGGASFTYKVGPDGARYAVAGTVNIDTGEIPNDPAATIRKAEQVRRAALAPTTPSPQDLRVAAEASEMARKAQAELQKSQSETRFPASVYTKNTLHSSTFAAVI